MLGGPEEEIFIKTIHELTEQKYIKIVLNMEGLTWINSLGIGKCISGMTTLRNQGGDLRLASMSPPVQSLMEKCSMNKIFQFHDSVEKAVKSFK